jgi:hypothetical protein
MARNTVEMTKAAITEVTHDPLKGKKLAPLSSACAGLSTAVLPNAAGAVGLAKAGFVRKVLLTKVLSSTNVELEGELVWGMDGEHDDAFVAGRMWSSSMYNSSGISKGANVGVLTSRAGSRRCRNTRRDPIRATR